MSTREEALKKLRAQIAEQRERLDPKVLRAAARAAELAQNPERMAGNMVPYDRENAAEAIRLFLDTHENQREFQTKLIALMKHRES